MAGMIRQRGAGIMVVLYIVATIAMAGLIAAQDFPTYTEYQSILKAVKKAAGGSTVQEIRLIYDKAAIIDAISSVQGKDLEIGKGPGDQVFVKFAYNKEIHLFGDAFLLIKYVGDSRQK